MECHHVPVQVASTVRARRRQRIFDVYRQDQTLDTYGQAQRTYVKVLRIAGKMSTGSSSKAELAEAVQGTQSNVLETRYVQGFVFLLDMKIIDIEEDFEYRITGVEDVDTFHNTFKIELEEVVL